MAYFENGEGNPNALSKRLMAQAHTDRTARPDVVLPAIDFPQVVIPPAISFSEQLTRGLSVEEDKVSPALRKRHVELDTKWQDAFTANGIPQSVCESDQFMEAVRSTCEFVLQTGSKYEIFQQKKLDSEKADPSLVTRLDSLVSIAQYIERYGTSLQEEDNLSTNDPWTLASGPEQDSDDPHKNSINGDMGLLATTHSGDALSVTTNAKRIRKRSRKPDMDGENGELYDARHADQNQPISLQTFETPDFNELPKDRQDGTTRGHPPLARARSRPTSQRERVATAVYA
jgi:hypothetical protein